MKTIAAATTPLAEFRADVISGLSRPQKMVPSRWLYDFYGSKLFEQITELWNSRAAEVWTDAEQLFAVFGLR